jgi:hypothetical protein
MYIIHTMEYFVYQHVHYFMEARVRAPNQRICVLVAMLGILFLAEREG